MGELEGGESVVCAGCYDHERLSSAFRFTHERSPMTGRYYTHRKATWNPDSEPPCERSHAMMRREVEVCRQVGALQVLDQKEQFLYPEVPVLVTGRSGSCDALASPEGFESADDERVVFWWSVRGTWDPVNLIEDSDEFGRKDQPPVSTKEEILEARLDELKSDRGGSFYEFWATPTYGGLREKGQKGNAWTDIRGPGPSSG
jgi:hypothetical protein